MNEPKLVEFTTSDGLTLPGLLYEAGGSKKTVIYLHGNGSSSVFYDEKGNRDLPRELNEKGITLLKFNNRGANIIKNLTIKKGDTETRGTFGMAYELIKDCVFDIDGAMSYLKELGYTEFYLAGASTGANKICVYDHYKPENEFKKYVLICGGDDTGAYNDILGNEKYNEVLTIAKAKIEEGKGMEIAVEALPTEDIFSYQGFYDIANPDGDYNCFPYSEAFGMAKLSKKPLFRYFSGIKKDSFVIYGDHDEYTWGNIDGVVKTLKSYQPDFAYKIIKDADHRFTGKKDELAKAIADWI